MNTRAKVEAVIKMHSLKYLFLNSKWNPWKVHEKILYLQWYWSLQAGNYCKDSNQIFSFLLQFFRIRTHLFHRTFFMALCEIRTKAHDKYIKINTKYISQTLVSWLRFCVFPLCSWQFITKAADCEQIILFLAKKKYFVLLKDRFVF